MNIKCFMNTKSNVCFRFFLTIYFNPAAALELSLQDEKEVQAQLQVITGGNSFSVL